MSTACRVTTQALEYVVKTVPVGTNLALFYLLWALVSGAFLGSRGAIFPALLALGLTAQEVRRCSQAVRTGSWSTDALVARWRRWVTTQTQWQPCSYGGYRPLAVDLTAFWRPRLRSWAGKFFYRLADRAIKGIGFALVVQVGQNRGQRLPLLQRIIRAESASLTESQFKAQVLKRIGQELAPHDVLVHDAGATVADMQTAGVARWVVRLDRNGVARRNTLPPRTSKKGRPAEYGERVRPLPRTYKDHTLPATPPDVTTHFDYAGRRITVHGWHDLVRSDQKVACATTTFAIWVYHDPQYRGPLVLGTNLLAQASTIYQLYHDAARKRRSRANLTFEQAVTPVPVQHVNVLSTRARL